MTDATPNLPTAVSHKQQLMARSTSELLAGLNKSVEATNTEVFNYLAFTGREGRFTISKGAGTTPEDFSTNTELLLSLFDTKQEYVCWKDGKLIDSKTYTLFEPMPPIESMVDHGPYSDKPDQREGWKKQYSISLRDMANNRQYRLNISAVSAVRSFDAFLITILEQSALHDIKQETPKVKLGVTAFKAQGHKNYKPSFDLVSWETNPKSPAELAAAKETAAVTEAVEEDKPVPSSRKK